MKTPWIAPTIWCNNEKGHSKHKTSAFLDGLKPVVYIGRLFGVLSRGDILSKQETERRITFPIVYSGFLATFFFVNAILFTRTYFLTFSTKFSTSDKLAELNTVGYACTMFFLYAYLLFATKRFRDIVQTFVTQDQKPSQLSKFPKTFTRFCWIITIICMLFGIGENIAYDVQSLTKRGKVNSTLELYYIQNFNHWSEVIPYHPFLTIILVVVVKCGTWGWVYGDVIPIVLTKALVEKLGMMNKQIQERIMTRSLSQTKTSDSESRVFSTSTTWDTIRDEFMALSNIAVDIQRFIVPLILTCYGVNVYIIMINLFLWISPQPSITLEQTYYVYFAFLNFLFRVTSVTYFAAEVHHINGSILATIQHCPNSLYTMSLERLEQILIANPIGVRLFGSFMITRKSFISILSFLFTTEIVLLQTVKD